MGIMTNRANRTSPVPISAVRYIPAPTTMPMPATTQIDAAVVSPRTFTPMRKIAPPPRKPMPETTCAAMRPGSPASKWVKVWGR